MSDYGSLYLIETSYNFDRDATEVIFGYLKQDRTIVGRISSIRVIVNIPGCGENEDCNITVRVFERGRFVPWPNDHGSQRKSTLSLLPANRFKTNIKDVKEVELSEKPTHLIQIC